ncbi:MAG: hypothetical protein EOP49_49130, partial [Sphingobacteriales bacterium]
MGALKNDREAMAMKSSLTSAFYIAVAAGLIWAFVTDKINKSILIGGIGLFVMIDLVSVASNYLNEDNYVEESEHQALFSPRPVDQQILQDKDPYYRVLDATRNTYNDAIQAYWHKSIGGYSPAKMEIYQDLIDMHMGGAQSQGHFNTQVLNMLNTKYIIFPGPQEQAVFQPNPGANGNAWFVDEVKLVKSADEEMLAMKAPALGDTAMPAGGAWDSRKTAVMRDNIAKDLNVYQFGKDSASAIRLTRYGLNDLSFVSNNSKNGLAVFSDIWYPFGWEATIDGKPAEILKANYVLRALKVPAGQHTIEFHFRPSSFLVGDTIALIASIVLILVLAASIWFMMKRNDREVASG